MIKTDIKNFTALMDGLSAYYRQEPIGEIAIGIYPLEKIKLPITLSVKTMVSGTTVCAALFFVYTIIFKVRIRQ